MIYRKFEDIVRDCMADAKKKGIAEPVFMVLSEQSSHARAMFKDLHGRPMAPAVPDQGNEFGPHEVLSCEDASRLLRRHGEQGGAHAADLLNDIIHPEFWIVVLLKETICTRAFLGGVEMYHSETPYDRVRRDSQTPRQLIEDAGPSMWKVKMDGGQIIPVCGPQGTDAIMAAALVAIAVDRAIEMPYQGKLVRIEMDDDSLASFLLDVYGDKPRAIAEAIMSLKKAGGDKEHWLKQVLGTRPELRELAKKVHSELTGE